ncbi:MAG: M48 family metallopeptidase [Planctomycetota bacterium]|nr:M48 family metallopeptidase [Planctomycetota bacterium]
MDDFDDTFSGGVFHADIADGRAGASIDCGVSALSAVTTTGARFELRYDACTVRIGGASGRMVFCRSLDQSLTIFCEQKGFAAALQQAAGGLLDEGLAQSKSELRGANARSRNLMFGLCLGCVVLLVAGYFALMAAGRAALAAAPPSIDEKIGELAIEQMDLKGSVVEDPAIVAPLEALVARLAATDPDDPFSYTLTVVDADITNAFALPGGQIAIYTGLLELADSPEQIAGVLGHEIAHVTERHGMHGIARSLGLVVAIQFLVGDAGGLVAVAAEFGRFAAENAYSRDQEADSDRLGVERLHAAGIDPRGLAGFFELLERETASDVDIPSWMSTHPDHAARIAAITTQAQRFSNQTYTPAIPTADWDALKAALSPTVTTPSPPEETSDGRDNR